MDRTLKLIATFSDQGALTGLKVLNTELEKTDSAGKKGKTGLLGFGDGMTQAVSSMAEFAGAAALVGVGFKQVYDQAKEGASLELETEKT